MMRVCVQGLWHLGSVTAACLASVGHRVCAFDFDQARVEDLRNGSLPVLEPGLAEMMSVATARGNLTFSSAPASAVHDIDVLWVAYDTPVDADDRADVSGVVAQIERILPYLGNGVVVLVSSQMPVGSIARLERTARVRCADKDLRFACSPENLRLGKALQTFLHPDRVVVGCRQESDRAVLSRLLEPVSARVEWMSVESAEMTKHAINAFLATSVTFANELATLCELVGADAKEVERAMRSERRIGASAYIAPGAAFAGGTLARDVLFLTATAEGGGLRVPLISSVKSSNDEHRHWAERKLRYYLPNLQGIVVSLWGLTYKPGTDTLRRSLAIELCSWLVGQGAAVRVHDPAAEELPGELAARVVRTADPLDAVRGARVLVVCTEWPAYREISAAEIVQQSPGLLVLDPGRFLVDLSLQAGIDYVAVGSPDRPREPS